jgi:hypothetical protein
MMWKNRKQMVMGRPILILSRAAVRTLRTATWMSSVAVLCGCAFLPMPFPMLDMVIG